MASSKASEYYLLLDSAFDAQSLAVNDVVRSLAGRTRHLHELLTGNNPFPGEPPASMPNPDGRLGHNHRGPPWGSAFLHPVAWAIGAIANANVQSPPSYIVRVSTATSATSPGIARMENWGIYVPPYETLPSRPSPANFIAPYSRLYIYLIAHLGTAGSATLTVSARSRPRNGDFNDWREQAFTVTTTTEASFASTAGAATLWVDVAPGHNAVELLFKNASTTINMTITALALCQVVKRSH